MPRVDRKTHNTALFRDVNHRVAELARRLDGAPREAFICECANVGCASFVLLRPSEYAQVGDDPTTFLVVPGHEAEGEDVLVRRADYLIVRSTPSRAGVGADG